MIILEEDKVEEVRDILGAMFIKHRESDVTLKLSQWFDDIVQKSTKERHELYVKANN